MSPCTWNENQLNIGKKGLKVNKSFTSSDETSNSRSARLVGRKRQLNQMTTSSEDEGKHDY